MQVYSLVNEDPLSAWAWDRALNSTYYNEIISETFSLTQAQIAAIWYWRVESFGPVYIYPSAIQKYDLETINDIGWVQWTFVCFHLNKFSLG